MDGMKPWTKDEYVSLIRRCDSTAMVSKTSEDLPDPDTPANTVMRRFGIVTETSHRLFPFAPVTTMASWASALLFTGAKRSRRKARCPAIL